MERIGYGFAACIGNGERVALCVIDISCDKASLRIENLTDIVVGDPAILDFAGVVRKGDAVPVQGFGSSTSDCTFLRRHNSSVFS